MFSIKWIVVSTVSVGVLALAGFGATQFTSPFAGVGNVGLGFKTVGQVGEELQSQVSSHKVTVKTPTGEIETNLGDLGVAVENLDSVAQELHAEKTFWKLPAWNHESDIKIGFTVDETKIGEVLLTNPDNVVTESAGIEYVDGAYTLIPSVTGVTVPVDDLKATAGELVAGKDVKALESLTAVEDSPMVDNTVAGELAQALNETQAGFTYQVGVEQIKPVLETNLFTVTTGEHLDVVVNEDEVNRVASTVKELTDRDGKAAKVISDRDGGVLKTLEAGWSDRKLVDTPEIIVNKTMEGLTAYVPVVELKVEESTPANDATVRRIIVDLSDQKTYLLENENIVTTYTVSTGKPGTVTHEGNFRVRAFVRMQDMGCGPSSSYCTENVPWVVYFNGDEAFHGTYWHNNFGNRMSHGCVNLKIDEAKHIYDWANMNMEVEVRE